MCSLHFICIHASRERVNNSSGARSNAAKCRHFLRNLFDPLPFFIADKVKEDVNINKNVLFSFMSRKYLKSSLQEEQDISRGIIYL